MSKANIVRVMIFNYITSLIIAFVTVNILDAFGLNGGIYLGDLFGLYFLVVYGLNNLVEAGEIPNNHFRFIMAIICIVIFDILFVLILPLLFGSNVLPPTESLSINYGGAKLGLALSQEFYLVLFAIVMLIFNFIIYRKTKHLG